MAKTQLMTNVTRAFHKAGFQLKQHSPEILIVTGAISTIAGAVMACKATLKVNDVLAEAKTNIDIIHESKEVGLTPGGANYTADDSKKDLAIVYTQTGVKLIRLYAPAALTMMTGIGFMLTSNRILHKRNAAIAAAYAAVDKGFKEYRGRVIERFGKEVDRELKYNLKAQEVDTTVTDENGKETTKKETVKVAGPGMPSEFARFFDASCPDWHKNPEYSKQFLRLQQQLANDMLVSRGYLFLNEVYEMLGLRKSEAGQVVGWIYDPENPDHNGDNFVDFGMFDITREASRDFINENENVVLIDPNVDGVILDKAFTALSISERRELKEYDRQRRARGL